MNTEHLIYCLENLSTVFLNQFIGGKHGKQQAAFSGSDINIYAGSFCAMRHMV